MFFPLLVFVELCNDNNTNESVWFCRFAVLDEPKLREPALNVVVVNRIRCAYRTAASWRMFEAMSMATPISVVMHWNWVSNGTENAFTESIEETVFIPLSLSSAITDSNFLRLYSSWNSPAQRYFWWTKRLEQMKTGDYSLLQRFNLNKITYLLVKSINK